MKRAAVAVAEGVEESAPEAEEKKKTRKKKKKKGRAVNATAKPTAFTPLSAQQRAEALAKQIGKKLRVHCITGRRGADSRIQYMSTGHQVLDDAISGDRDDDLEIIDGTGKGLPRGRMVEIFGLESAAKTSLALCIVAEAQRRGEIAAFIDVEHAFNDVVAARMFGVKLEELLLWQPDDGEEALKILGMLAESGEVSLIVLDSVAALVSLAEKTGGKALGEQARMMSGACRRLTTQLNKPNSPTIIFINQVRYKIGVVFGNPEITSGGKALGFYSSVRLEVRKRKNIKKTSKKKSQKGTPKIVGMQCAIKCIKNKVAPMGGAAKFTFHFKKGISFDSLDEPEEEEAEESEEE